MFDDAYIGYRISENVAKGNGLVFNAGQKLWVNTSFLYPLYNGVYFLIAGNNAIQWAVFSDVLLHIFTLYLLYLMLLKILPIEEKSAYQTIFIISSLLLISIRVSSGVTCGMESNFYTLFIALSIYYFLQKKYYLAFLVAAICFWIRPEGCLVSVALYISYMWQEKKIFEWKYIATVMSITILYFLIVYGYYGTFLPHSIVAKMLVEYNKTLTGELSNWWKMVSFHFTGVFYLAGCYFLFRKSYQVIVIFNILYMLFFTFVATWLYGWYHTAALIFYYWIVAAGIYQIKIWLAQIIAKQQKKHLIVFSWIPIMILVLFFVKFFYTHLNNQVLGSSGFQKRVKLSQEIATVIMESTNQNDIITLEPLGIISFFTKNRTFADYPGLCSKEVTELNKTVGRKVKFSPTDTVAFKNVIEKIQPTILVLREGEYKANQHQLQAYKTLKNACIDDLTEKEVFVTGISKCFVVLKRNSL
jgi:hypothetical protein